jgi:catechol 2,3-dioxygenase-like lactoylglutathione lyase family enzyme
MMSEHSTNFCCDEEPPAETLGSSTGSDAASSSFHVSDAEFDAILGRIKTAGLSYGSAPWILDDGKINDWDGGRGFYFKDPNGHVLELMTVPQGG